MGKMSGLGDSIQRVTEDDKLKGVRGWLLLPPVIVVITDLNLVFALVRPLLFGGALLMDQWLSALTLFVLLIPLSVFGVLRLMNEKKDAVRPLIVFFVIIAIVNALDLAGYFLNGPQSELYGLNIAVGGLRGLGVPVAVIVYLLRSKRVKLTLVN